MSDSHSPRFDFRGFGVAYARTAPLFLLTWALVAAAGGTPARAVFITGLMSVFFVPAAARSSRGFAAEAGWVSVARRAPAHLASAFMLFLLTGLAGVVGATLGAMVADALSVRRYPTSTLAVVLFSLPVLWRYWPAAVLAFVAPGDAAARYVDAGRLVRRAGSPARSAVVLGLAYLWLAVLLALGEYRHDGPFPLAVHGATWLVGLPLLVWLAIVETERMIDEARRGAS